MNVNSKHKRSGMVTLLSKKKSTSVKENYQRQNNQLIQKAYQY